MNDNKSENQNVVDNSSLLELIQSIQDKMNNNTNENNENVKNEKNNEKSSIESDTTYTKNLDNVDNDNSNYNNNKQNIDFSNLSSILNNIDLSSVLGLLSKMNTNTNKEENSSFNFDKLDPNLINKIQKVIMSMGKNDPRKDLLKSLKPFLRKSRQDKLGEYISMLNIVNAIQIFNDKGSE